MMRIGAVGLASAMFPLAPTIPIRADSCQQDPLPSWLFAIPGMKQWFGRDVAPGLLAKQFADTLVGLPDAERLL